MDKKVLIGIIGEKLEIIQEQFAIIKEYDGKIPVIEIDLLMSNIRDLYELFITLQQKNQGVYTGDSPVKPAPSGRPPEPTPPAPAPAADELGEQERIHAVGEGPDSGTSSVPSFRPPAILGFEPVIEKPEQSEPVESSPVTEPLPSPETIPPVDDRPSAETGTRKAGPSFTDHREPRPQRTTFDLFSEGGSGTLADRFKDSQEKRVADRLSENKTTDLRGTIGINDKFLFINELFDGNMRIYEEAVKKLNECPTLAQADLMLLDFKIVYNWDSESPTVKKFVELVRRKF